MIKVTKNITITGPSDSEYLDFLLYSSNSCVQITVTNPSTGNRITGNSRTITVEFGFADSSCFTSSITLEVTNDNGCKQSNTFTLDNPCSTFVPQVVNVNSGGNPFIFSTTIVGGIHPYTIQWSYDNTIFNLISSGNTLELSLIEGISVPAASNIFATVTDSNGCVSQAVYAYQFLAPVADDKNLQILCNPDAKTISSCGEVVGQTLQTQLNANTQSGTSIDWSSIQFTNNNSLLCPTHIGNGKVIIYSKEGSITSNKEIGWSVANNIGIRSNTATLNIRVTDCDLNTSIIAHNNTVILTPTTKVTAGETVVDIENNIIPSSGRSIDWDSFTFKQLTGQTLVSATELTTANGSAILTPARQVKYTVGTPTLPVDVVSYTVDDDLGNTSNKARIYFDFESDSAPTVPDQTRSVGTGSSRNINLLTGATGNPLPNNILITQVPTNGVYTLGTDGTVTYSPTINIEGTDIIKYKVYNSEGVESAEITLNLTIVHAGINSTISHCIETETVDLVTPLGLGVTTGGTWAENSNNPTTGISLASPGAVDLTGANEGAYGFTYSVTSDTITTTKQVIVNYSAYSATHLTTTSSTATTNDPIAVTSRFQLNPENIPFGNVRFQIHNGASPLTPGSGNIINELAPTSSNSSTGIFELKLTDGLGTSLPATTGVYMVRLKVTTACGDIFYVSSGVEIDGNDGI